MSDAKQDEQFAPEVARIRQAYARRTDQSRYSPSEPAHALAVAERNQKLQELLTVHGFTSLSNTKILDVGCGMGLWLRQFLDWGARPENLCGIDLLPERIEQARERCAGAHLLCQSATQIPEPDDKFDLVLQSTMFTSILNPAMKQKIAHEMLRVLRPQGLILWYDFYVNNPWNPDVRGIKQAEIQQLFPECSISLKKITLSPPLARPIARMSPSFYRVLSRVELLCTHYLGVIRKTSNVI